MQTDQKEKKKKNVRRRIGRTVREEIEGKGEDLVVYVPCNGERRRYQLIKRNIPSHRGLSQRDITGLVGRNKKSER